MAIKTSYVLPFRPYDNRPKPDDEVVTLHFDPEGIQPDPDKVLSLYFRNKGLMCFPISHTPVGDWTPVTICSPYGDVVIDVNVGVCTACGGRMHRKLNKSLVCESCGSNDENGLSLTINHFN